MELENVYSRVGEVNEGWSNCHVRPNYKIWDPSAGKMRLSVNMTTAYKQEGRKKKEKQINAAPVFKSCQFPHLRKLLEISFKPVRMTLFTAGSELPEAPARGRCGCTYHQQVQGQLSDSQWVDKD